MTRYAIRRTADCLYLAGIWRTKAEIRLSWDDHAALALTHDSMTEATLTAERAGLTGYQIVPVTR